MQHTSSTATPSLDGRFTPGQLSVLGPLEDLLIRWQKSGREPDLTGVLSPSQYAALLFAAGKEQQLTRLSPLDYLVSMDPFLVRWVMLKRGLANHIGMELGTD
jgi:hypothetical protein